MSDTNTETLIATNLFCLQSEVCLKCEEFIENSKKSKKYMGIDLLDSPPDEFFSLIPEFVWIHVKSNGEVNSEVFSLSSKYADFPIVIPECIRYKFYEKCSFAENEYLARCESLLVIGVTFENVENKITHFKTLIFDEECASDIIKEYLDLAKKVEESFLKETGCKTLKDALEFLEAKSLAKEKQEVKKARQREESNFEFELLSFLEIRGFKVQRQVHSGHLRMDLLIPNQLIIELKVGKVNGDDVCQAADYLASHAMDVLLVGTGLTNGATRGIEAINRISKENQLLFVTRNACFRYLNGALGKQNERSLQE
jgi:very-short-patch-repair endonuclease